MNGKVLILWLLTIMIDTIGQLAFKAAAVSSMKSGWSYWRYMLIKPWIWIGLISYVLEFLLWLAFLSLVPLSKGVLLGSINIVVIMLAGRLIFHETLSKWRLLGMSLITLGVMIVGLE